MLQPICSESSLAAGEPLAGSAPEAAAWLCLQQSGPWGRKAWTQSHLDPELGGRIEQAAGDAGVRPSLIRRPGRHPDNRRGGARVVLAAYCRPGGAWLLRGQVDDPAELLRLDLAALAAGDVDAVRRTLPALEPDPEPQLLVCTNGQRDTCCARLGRPVVLSAAVSHPETVWEVTHTSGHRFAPTTVLLPSGYLHGRVLDGANLLESAAEGQVAVEGLRGRSVWPAPAQAAEIHVREQEGLTGIDDLEVAADGDGWLVRHRDGRSWRVTVATRPDGERAESCGKDLKPVTRYVVTSAEPVTFRHER
jgi:hypothetical protein